MKVLEYDAETDRRKILMRGRVFWMSGLAWDSKDREELLRYLSETVTTRRNNERLSSNHA